MYYTSARPMSVSKEGGHFGALIQGARWWQWLFLASLNVRPLLSKTLGHTLVLWLFEYSMYKLNKFSFGSQYTQLKNNARLYTWAPLFPRV